MAEGVAVAASMIAVIQISERIITTCKHYIESLQDAPSDLRLVLSEISSLKTIFENLEFLNSCYGGESALMTSLQAANGPVNGCHQSIQALESLFPSDNIQEASQSRSKKRKLKATLTTLGWSAKQSKAKKLLADIAQYRGIVSLTLSTESVQDVKKTKAETSQVYKILTDGQRSEVLRWLPQTDPSPIHNRNQRLYEPETAEWVLRLPAWTIWIDAGHRCLWIHGIPGAGKSVLMSHVIEQLDDYCDESTLQCISVYYYCHHGRNQDEAVPFLRWLLSQLCCEADRIPSTIYKAYKSLVTPSIKVLLEAIGDILGEFDRVYVLLDAIDESSPREDLLEVLRTFITDPRLDKVQLLASSRRYKDIERVMKEVSLPVSMSNPYVGEDIRRKIHSQLHSDREFSQWPQDLLQEVEDAVSEGAHGMFRLAVCQLLVLSEGKCARDNVQKALKDLPKTLDETYDRILAAVPEDKQPFVHHALQWIIQHAELYDGRGIPSAVLPQAVEKSTATLNAGLAERMCNNNTLQESCGCLIEIAEEEDPLCTEKGHHQIVTVSLAHYTVREYLDSNRVSESSSASTQACKLDLQPDLTRTTFLGARNINAGALSKKIGGSVEKVNGFDLIERTFCGYCIISAMNSLWRWPIEISQQDETYSLAIDLLDPSKSHYEYLVYALQHCNIETGIFRRKELWPLSRCFVVHWKTFPEEIAAAQVLHLLCMSTTSVESEASPSALPLLAKSLNRKDADSILRTRLRLSQNEASFNLSVGLPTRYDFDGTLIEIAAQMADHAKVAFGLLLHIGASSYDPSNILVLYIGNHFHGPERKPCNEEACSLIQLLKQGADPNDPTSYVTPLQIAVAIQDLEAIDTLLKADADANAVGNVNGRPWGESTKMERFNHLAGKPPLGIIKGGSHRWSYCGYVKDNEELAGKIENILLEHGAQVSSAEARYPHR